MNELTAKNWSIIRGRGLLRFTLRTGVAELGLPCGILLSIVYPLMHGQSFRSLLTASFLYQMTAQTLLTNIVGLACALGNWLYKERQYARYLRDISGG